MEGNNRYEEETRRIKFGAAWNASYADMFDFTSAGNKNPLKACEIFFDANYNKRR